MVEIQEDDTWDAGDTGCGELLLGLRKRLKNMPGGTLKVIAHDPGAQEDFPAFCRITRHELIHAAPPVYWVRARTADAAPPENDTR